MMHKRILGLVFVLGAGIVELSRGGDTAPAVAAAGISGLYSRVPEAPPNTNGWLLLQRALETRLGESNSPASREPRAVAAPYPELSGRYHPVPEPPDDTNGWQGLQDALERRLNRPRPGGIPGPPQLILAPQPPAGPGASSNQIQEFKAQQIREAHRREAMLPGRPFKGPAPPPTNQAAFNLKGYQVSGNTLLPEDVVSLLLRPYIATNATIDFIYQGLSDLQKVYGDRGYPTVSVALPPQKLTNGIVQVRVVEGRLAEIRVRHNQYFSSNNLMRALPSLRTNMILNSYIFQTELDQANRNQDRQIYPQLEAGVEPGTSELDLQVKDRLPLHFKEELNNQNSPGTPDLRLNTSIAYNNLWQHENQLGFQYNFSPEAEKLGNDWAAYDIPKVANYSGFYRLPLSAPAAVAEEVNKNVGQFGYSEATRRYNLPPPSGQAELSLYASRSTIDTGIEGLLSTNLFNTNGNTLDRNDYQQGITVNNDLGGRLTVPMPSFGKVQSTISLGLDYKQFSQSNYKTNVFKFTTVEVSTLNGTTEYITNRSTVPEPVPATVETLHYLPLSLRWDGGEQDPLGVTSFGLGISINTWFSGSLSNLHDVASSTESSGIWAAVTPTLERDFLIRTNWMLSLRADAQAASEPLPVNEQFGAGGVNSVRGYHEGEVFGDDGWHLSAELKSPAHVVGLVAPRNPLVVRGSWFMDYAKVYLIDPQGRQPNEALWSTGVGMVASVGYHWSARFIFAVPLKATFSTARDELEFKFSISAEF